MTFSAKVTQDHQLRLPDEIWNRLGLTEDATVELEENLGVVTLRKPESADFEQRLEAIEDALQHYGGSMREAWLAAGNTSVEEYVRDMRGR